MSFSLVQHAISPATGNAAAGTSFNVAFGNPVGAGNTVVGMVVYGQIPGDTNEPQIQSIQDDKSNNYPLLNFLLDNVHTFSESMLFLATGIKNGPKTYTFGFGSNTLPVNNGWAVLMEWSGIAALTVYAGQLQNNPGTATDAVTSGLISPGPNDLIVGFSAETDGSSLTLSAGTGETPVDEIGNGTTGMHLISEYKVRSNTFGQVASTFTNSLAGAGIEYFSYVAAFTPAVDFLMSGICL